MDKFDVVVVGGGPAGSIAGYLLKKANYKVLIIDKKEFPREKLCGGLVTQKSINLLEEIFNKSFVDSLIEDKKDTVEIFYKGSLINRVKTKIPFYLVNRKKFDYLLLKQYINIGGEFKSNTSFTKIETTKNEIFLTDGNKIKFRYLIGADGALSRTRKYVDPSFKPSGYCLESFISTDKPESCLKIYFGDLKSGYGWIFPRNNTDVVGIGGDFVLNKDSFKTSYSKINKTASDFFQKPKGAFIPFGEIVKKPVKEDKIFLIGDAAGLVDPVTGEGIYYALKSGEIVSNAIIKSDGNVSAEQIFLNSIKFIQKEIKNRKPVRKIIYGKGNFLFFNTLGKIKPLVRYVCDNIISL